MPHTTHVPDIDHPIPTTPAAAPPAELSLEDRLTLIDAAMTVRLDEAKVAYEVNTAHIPTEPVDLADVITGPLDTGNVPLPDLYPPPVAALLHRAHHRLVTGGWCRGALVDAEGARCMFGAIRAEARSDAGLESSAVSVVMDAIRRKFDGVDSVPGFNDAFASGRTPIRMVDQAAGLADARGL
ncbi:DUF6197 family protein [Streptomyces sp. NBC_00724]|uniref:DUF6197 family protein n=1 Tax=Streptomyces sp. NBC_00724 TaxID=2975812 RepID=UPI002ED6B100|nr:hypothetical protein OHB17_42285 [Streptomyces sp. NBC_00724]